MGEKRITLFDEHASMILNGSILSAFVFTITAVIAPPNPVRVCDPPVLTFNSFAADGRLVASASPRPWMRRLTYDAVGRLVRLEMPVVPSQTGPEDPVRLEDFRYDP